MGYSTHDGVFAPWCAILKCVFTWKKLTNITSRTVLEIVFSLFKPLSISLKEKKTFEHDHILVFPYFTLFLSYIFSFRWAIFCSHLSSVEVESKCSSVSEMGPVLHGHSWSSPSMLSLSQNKWKLPAKGGPVPSFYYLYSYLVSHIRKRSQN